MQADNDRHLKAGDLFRQACLDEQSALKPGNVHIFADGHGMVVQDFIQSAEASSRVIAEPGLGVGERIFRAVEATWNAAGCNTNLGIILLCAPIIHAALQAGNDPLRIVLQEVLRDLTVDDAVWAYRAIRRASPAGLGEVAQNDVHENPAVTLLAAMQAAQDRDFIARQYVNGYAEIFDAGVACYQNMLARWERPAWAATAVYLGFLSKFRDTHIERKFGKETAERVRKEAEQHEKAFVSLDNPKNYLPEFLRWDKQLKSQGINPGTSADLTVATLLAYSLEKP